MKLSSPALFFVAFTLLSSCASYRYIYSASPANNPYFTQKGDSKLTGYYSSSYENQLGQYAAGVDLQAAYAITNHWAVTVGYFNQREKDVNSYSTYDRPFDSSIVHYKRNLLDVGGGYFLPLNSSKTFILNLYSGMATGRFSFIDNGQSNAMDYERYHDSRITKWYFQPSVNLIPGKYFRFSFILKASFVHYGDILTSYTPDEQKSLSLDRINNKTLGFTESEINMQFGLPKYPWIKLDAGFSDASHQFPEDSRLSVRSRNVSIGFTFNVSRLSRNHLTEGR
ncbi:MAG TPA: hypothetical protein VN726_18970 [Hanamia sp.]|nr:hypothetical protein [Hanamia sp.]